MKKQTAITTVVVLAVILIAVLGYMHYKTTTAVAPATAAPAASTSVTIESEHINEADYTGTKPVIAGTGALAETARKYVADSIAAFAATAEKEVPGMRAKYGNDAPPAHYTIDINAKTVASASTQSIVIDSYVYMGGANGNSLYKAFTAKNDGTLLSIQSIVKADQQAAFVAYVQQQLQEKIEGLFTEDVAKLTIDSLANFSLDDKDMTVYFDKYQIGPGALGATAFQLPRATIQQYLTLPQ